MNWKIFGVKFDNRETWAFEQMSYLLFCAEFNNRIGLFRYKNQTGIETETIEKDGKYFGFQSKYYTTSITDNKDDIIDSIKKAKAKNKHLDELLLYINKELSESTIKSKKKPQYQLDIEKAAKTEGINIQWRVPSHFELQLSLPDNKYINDIFFSLDPNEGDLLDEIYKHNENILQAIQTEISFGDKQIKIDRSSVVEAIANTSQKKKNIIISGEGGCGKTSILKEFYNAYFNKIPICVFKANELNANHINDIFRFNHKFTFSEFLNAYKDEPLKIFVIDSAEKLAEISNNDILTTLIQKLKESAWNIIFTTRYAYLNDLAFHIKENYQLPFEVNDVSLIGADELKLIADEFKFSLPDNQKFLERLRNLFYLREYVQQYSNIDKQGNYNGFIDLLWKKRIQNTVQKDNLHLERERCIISIAKQRCETGRFYINADSLPQSALFQLKQDELLGYDDTHNGYFITHDIYEEWTLNKIVSRSFSNHSNTKEFFDDLGNSLPIRRAFRLWLSDHLSENSKEIESFIHDAFTNVEVTQFWKDEILVSVLLSEYSETFFNFFEKEFIANDFEILKRILFLLRIACTDISAIQNIEIIKPKGKGWEEVIALIYKHKSDFFDRNLKLVLPVLTDWCDFNKIGETTRYAGLLALSLIQKTETEENFYMQEVTEENIMKVVFNAANELKSELKEIFDKVVSNKWTEHRDPYEGLCSKILEKPYIAAELIKTLPLSVIQLCDLFWQKQPKKKDRFGYDRETMESRYGLAEKHEFNYFPSSANQTPVKWLLQIEFYKTLDFIIDFTNRAVESYSKSDYGKEDVVKVTLHTNGTEVTQYLSGAIWSMYRGNGSPVVPNVLQSIHMALEKILLDYSQILDSELIQDILLRILNQSNSTSFTSIVCSVVLANPDKFYDVALILFKTIEFFHLDTSRCTNEFHIKSLYSIGYGMDKIRDILYTDERLKTCEDTHRNSNLESLFLNYQLFGVKGFTDEENTEFIGKLFEIIDQHKSSAPTSKSYGILLARMDRRNLIPKVSKHDENHLRIEFSPKELSDELKKESEEALNQYQDVLKYSSLRVWADFLVGARNQTKTTKQEEYDNNPLLALSETKQLVEELKEGRNGIGMFDHSIPAFSCSKLLLEHKDKLSKEDKAFCKEIVLATISNLFADDYGYQISDGVEAAVHAIPALVIEHPEETEDYVSIMVLALLDETSIGHYKRICDYVIESIHKSKLWEQDSKVAQSILFGYIKIKPIYKSIIAEIRKEKGWGRISKNSIFERLGKINDDFTFENISFDINNIASLDIHDLEIVLQIIPSETKDKIHLDIYTKSLPSLASQLLIDRRSYKDDSGDDSNIYLIRKHIFKKFAHFILQREKSEIDVFLKPFVDSFSSTEETASFIEELVFAEDYLNSYEQFWHIWNNLYPKIKELCSNPRSYHLKEIIINYLFAWRWWREGIEEWRSLKKENLTLYNSASKEIGNIPSVLYSIIKILNSIGSNFKDEGIEWLHTIVSNNKSLYLDDLESNTLYYLEMFLRKYIFINRQKIKEEIRLKNKIIPILDFMIERGSIHGYLLRESIL
ncbi:AVAST type 4 anti-phage nuclease Avs4 [Cohnella terricola]|uniref:ATP-binding protein n=1 Tax=Cohnella terricola TaxID=1289167 RepID=A0A559JBU1_9BACL|nr:AVAST type 4 anti-phage nuclease Avs4 [Cohnella terricola]TVX97335.1 ATP-binding protein [Cohnella terricola]